MTQAMERLQELSSQPLTRSSLWITSPIDCPPNSPPFINAVVGVNLRPEETPESLFARLQEIEQEFGLRPRKVPNEPRALDLDLLVFGSEIRESGRLRLPHPRAHQRRFVLAPLSEIAPDLVLPLQTKSVRELLAELKDSESVVRLGGG